MKEAAAQALLKKKGRKRESWKSCKPAIKNGVLASLPALIYAWMPRAAFASNGSLDITDLHSILVFAGAIVAVYGAIRTGIHVIRFSQSLQEQQGMQSDASIWGIVGSIAIIIGGGAFVGAGLLWPY